MIKFFIELMVGTIAAVVGYVLARRLLDFIGLENWFQNSIWHYTVSQFGEMILLVLVIAIVVLIGLAFGLFQNLQNFSAWHA